MAKFSSPIWIGSEGNSNAQLEVAVALWLRNLGGAPENDLGLVNFIRLTVTPSNHLFFVQGIPDLTVTCISNGQVLNKLPGINMLWTNDYQRITPQLCLSSFDFASRELRIHVRWLEHALAKAIESLYNHHIDWTAKFKKAETIGGIEKADWI